MKFKNVLFEGNFSVHSIIPKIETKKNKYELLKACGYDVTFDFQKEIGRASCRERV